MEANTNVFPTAADMQAAVTAYITDTAARCVRDNGRFTIALAGGSTPRPIYQALATAEYQSQINWAQTHIFFGDERCVPPTHDDSNYSMVREVLLTHVPIPLENVHRIKGELAPEEAAKDYGLFLKDFFDGGLPAFDLHLLGMGSDGHTASLLPHTPSLAETEHRAVTAQNEHHPHVRVTLTAHAINAAHRIMVLVSGAGKAATLKNVLQGPDNPQEYPVQLIENPTFYIDEAAATLLD